MNSYVAPFIFGVLLGFIALSMCNDSNNKQPVGFEETASLAVHDSNICLLTGDFFQGLYIDIEYPVETYDWVGRWEPDTATIKLKLGLGTDIDTVAHEVYHAVEDIMYWYEIEDPHYGAWLQGSLTNCVWTIVEKDLEVINN